MQGVRSLETHGLKINEFTEYERRGIQRWQADHKRLADLPIQYYRIVSDPLAVETEEAAVGDLCDDLADINNEL